MISNRRAILHIGTEKTGTTALQQLLYSNASGLRRSNAHLLNSIEAPNNRGLVSFLMTDFDDHMRYMGITTLAGKSKHFSGFEGRFAREVQSLPIDATVIITSEHFSSRLASLDEVRGAHDFLRRYFEKIVVVCYFRPQSEWEISRYSTGLKLSETRGVEQAFELERADFYPVLAENWSRVFGRDNCLFRAYGSPDGKDFDVRRDFVELLNSIGVSLEESDLEFADDRSNESLSLLQAAAFLSINRKIPHWTEDIKSPVNGLNLELKKRVSKIPGLKVGKLRGLDATQEAVYAESNRAFAKEFLGNPGILERTEAVTPGPTAIPIEDVELLVRELTSALLDFVSEGASRTLLDKDADTLRDSAAKILDGKALSRQDALELLLLAHRARPAGPLILKMIDQLKSLKPRKPTSE